MKKIEFRDVEWPHDKTGPGSFSLAFVKSVYTPIATFLVSVLKQLRMSSFVINFKCVAIDDKTESLLFRGKITGRADGDNAAISAFELNTSSSTPSCRKEFCLVKVADSALATKVLDARITFSYCILKPEPDEDELEALNYALKSAVSNCLDRQVGPIVPQEMAF